MVRREGGEGGEEREKKKGGGGEGEERGRKTNPWDVGHQKTFLNFSHD